MDWLNRASRLRLTCVMRYVDRSSSETSLARLFFLIVNLESTSSKTFNVVTADPNLCPIASTSKKPSKSLLVFFCELMLYWKKIRFEVRASVRKVHTSVLDPRVFLVDGNCVLSKCCHIGFKTPHCFYNRRYCKHNLQ